MTWRRRHERQGEEAQDGAFRSREALRGEGVQVPGDARAPHLPVAREEEGRDEAPQAGLTLAVRRALVGGLAKWAVLSLAGKPAAKAEAFLRRRVFGRG